MVKAIINEEVYVKCTKCEVYKKPVYFGKNKRRKSCDTCKLKK